MTLNITPKQIEVLQHVADGKSLPETAEALGLSPKTVRIHASASYRHLGVRHLVHAVVAAHLKGLIHFGDFQANE